MYFSIAVQKAAYGGYDPSLMRLDKGIEHPEKNETLCFSAGKTELARWCVVAKYYQEKKVII